MGRGMGSGRRRRRRKREKLKEKEKERGGERRGGGGGRGGERGTQIQVGNSTAYQVHKCMLSKLTNNHFHKYFDNSQLHHCCDQFSSIVFIWFLLHCVNPNK